MKVLLTQKERNVIRTQLEGVLHRFECEVSNNLRNNKLQLAKVNHNVVDVVRGILNKIQIADWSETITDKYYLVVDTGVSKDTYAILLHKNDNELKINKFITITESRLDKIAVKLIEEIKPFNGEIIIPNIAMGRGIIDYVKCQEFNNIIELDLNDINNSKQKGLILYNDKNKLYELMDADFANKEYIIGFTELFRQLDNLELQLNLGNCRFVRKNNDTDIYWILNIFYALERLDFII